jgi:glycerol-3-phosphate dehydrogenase
VIRDLALLTGREFDVLVIGGGIYGLTIAYDAAQRGLSVALVERGDFGAATSFNHLKTIHGGLRYLQTADLPRMREAIRERRTFARIAPKFVAPQAFIMPAGATLTRHRLILRAAVTIEGIVASDRNNGIGADHRLPAGRLIERDESRALLESAIGRASPAMVWHDYVTTDGDRLTLSFAKAAVKHGAVVANYVDASSWIRQGGRIVGVQVCDVLTGRRFDITSRIQVNATGPWGATTLDRAGLPQRWLLLKAMNLVTSRPAGKAAIVAPTPGGRALVLLPWRGRTLVGTSESATERNADDQGVNRQEIEGFVSEINSAFPAFALDAREITLVHRGIVPAASKNGNLTLLGRSRIIDHQDAGLPGLITVVGVKYTTARATAQRVVDLLLKRLNRPPVECRTAITVLPDAAIDDRDAADPAVSAVREEMAQTLADVVIRRTGHGATGYPGDSVAQGIAGRVKAELGWSEERSISELDALKRFYQIS